MSDTPGPAVPLDIPANCPGTVTALLQSWTHGDPDALAKVLPLVYDELRAIARSYMRHERPGHTLGVTGLVHEAFLRLSGQAPEAWRDRKHFYGIAARLIRQVLVDYSRHHSARKRDPEMSGAEPPQAASLPKALDADNVHAGPHELSIDSPGGSVSQRLVLAAAKTILNLASALPGGTSVPSSPLVAMVHSALGLDKILEPGGAWELYQQLVRERAGDPQRGAIEAALSAALAGIGQRAINDYVQLPPTELRPDTFHRAARAFHFQKVLEPGETQLDAKRLFSAGRALIVERNYSQAIEALRQAAALDPKAAYSHNALGLAHEALRKDDEATRDFQTAAKLAPA